MRFVRTLSLIAFGVALAAVAGLAYGAIGQGGVINGCYKTTTPHNLQVIDPAVTSTCPSGTTSLTWDQRDQTNAYSTYHDAPQTLNADESLTAVGSLKLPDGSFMIIAKTDLQEEASDNATFGGCTLTAGGDSDTSHPEMQWSAPGIVTSSTITTSPIALTVAHTFKTGGSARLTCFMGAGGVGGSVQNVKITAIQVAAVSNIGF